MPALMNLSKGKIGGSTTGCMSRPSTMEVKLTGEETSMIAQFAFDNDMLLGEALKELLLTGLLIWLFKGKQWID